MDASKLVSAYLFLYLPLQEWVVKCPVVNEVEARTNPPSILRGSDETPP